MNSTRGIDSKNIVLLLEGFQEKIDHDPFSESTYQISKERHKNNKNYVLMDGHIP